MQEEFKKFTSEVKSFSKSSDNESIHVELKDFDYKVYVFIIFALLSSFVSSKIFDYQTKKYEDRVYTKLNESILQETKILIAEKLNTSTLSAMSLAQNPKIAQAISGKKNLINFKEFSLELRNNTNFKNVWFMIANKDGIVIERSWTDIKGDNVLKNNTHIKEIIKRKKVKSILNVNKFDLVFSSISPVIVKNNVIGVVAVITHFNSISKYLTKNGFKTVVFLNKENSRKLDSKSTLSKNFIADFENSILLGFTPTLI